MPAKMAAFESVPKQLQPFLAIFQLDYPLLPFMASTLHSVFPLKFCKHRWLENIPIVVRGQEIWDNFILYVQKVLDLAIKAEKSAMEGFNVKVDRLDIFLQKHIGSVSSMSKLWDLLRELDSFPWSSNC